MLYHNHVWRRELVSGSPDPDDPDDDQLLLEIRDNGINRMLAYSRDEWAPLFQALRSLQQRGRPDHRNDPHP